MLLVIQISIILFAIIVLAFIIKVGGLKLNDVKKNISVIITYIITVIIFMIVLNNISFIKEIIENSVTKILDEFILFVISTGFAVTTDTVIVAIIQKVRENNLIKKYENDNKAIEFKYYRDIISDISPAMLSYIYSLKIKFDDQIVAAILYLQMKDILDLHDGVVMGLAKQHNYGNTKKLLLNISMEE